MKNKKIIIIMIAAAVMVYAGIATAACVFITKLKHNNATSVEQLSENVQEIKTDIGKCAIGDYEEKYNSLQNDTDNAINNKNQKDLKELYKNWQDLYAEIKTENDNQADKYYNELVNKDLSKAYDDEKAKIQTYINSIAQCKENGDYTDLKKNYEECMNIFDDINKPGTALNMSVYQVDASDYPLIRLYIDVKDSDGKVPSGLRADLFKITESVNKADNSELKIEKFQQLNDSQNINIDMVADVSGSMSGSQFQNAKSAMKYLLDAVQFNVGDKVELINFSDNVNVSQEFSNSKSQLVSKVDQLKLGNMTCLYDALYASVNRTAAQSGAKCVIAFTDGLDNISKCTVDTVINQAKHYKIPIFIIGIGSSLDTTSLKKICDETGGAYSNIANASSMSSIYKQIYNTQKQLYVLEYTTNDTQSTYDSHSVMIDTVNREYEAKCSYTFSPNILKNVDVNSNNDVTVGSDVDKAVENYLKGFVKAINANNYSLLKPYVEAGSSMEKIQSKYVMTEVTEKLKNYEITSRQKINDSKYVISVTETYSITHSDGELEMLVQKTSYVVNKQKDNTWKVADFNEDVEVVQSIGA